ncbi:hypothetical protein [Haloarcula salinisoli]|uniref:Uncharacterized protein n=1 Tax=Haloarcula salinisoli TaxID=2487746 RepID=A0A8J7YIV8_9EURY|nr:hypothetical protein [Halomicroarcula salinisoli]MBX0286839.1 hypothetical protein [Halomicroarcula salinisoli]MBX0304141.1 hypothetical protein [Halomicroarcula salinisoli]
MGDPPSPDQDVLRALELADGYLDEAEDLLWAAATESAADDVSEPIEELTQEVWDVQARLETLKEEFETE